MFPSSARLCSTLHLRTAKQAVVGCYSAPSRGESNSKDCQDLVGLPPPAGFVPTSLLQRGRHSPASKARICDIPTPTPFRTPITLACCTAVRQRSGQPTLYDRFLDVDVLGSYLCLLYIRVVPIAPSRHSQFLGRPAKRPCDEYGICRSAAQLITRLTLEKVVRRPCRTHQKRCRQSARDQPLEP